MYSISYYREPLKYHHGIPYTFRHTVCWTTRCTFWALRTPKAAWDSRGGTNANGKGKDDGGEEKDDENGGENHGHPWWIIAEQHMEVDGGNGVEEGAAWY